MKNHEAFYNTDIASGPWTSPTLTLTGTMKKATPAAAAISPRLAFPQSLAISWLFLVRGKFKLIAHHIMYITSLSLETVQIDSPKLMESKRFLLGIYGGEAIFRPQGGRNLPAGYNMSDAQAWDSIIQKSILLSHNTTVDGSEIR